MRLGTARARTSLVLALSLWVLSLGVARAQNDVVAFGDSITEGPYPFDEKRLGGYPSRLEVLLRDAGQANVHVFNEGRSGESTGQGLSRIDAIINKHRNRAGTFIIMEGTNDINRVAAAQYSVETVVQNLEAMGRKVRAAGMTSMYATIIPRPNWARIDSSNALTYSLVYRLRELTSGGERPLAEPWEIFENEGAPGFRKYYFCCDVVGHPNAAGFDLLAEHFAEKVLGEDTMPPVISSFTKSGGAGVLSPGDVLKAVVHESGAGIVAPETYFTINGREVSTKSRASRRRAELTYQVANRDIACAARITVRTADAAQPPNIRNRTMAELSVGGARYLDGDVNGDCRVDGFDLSLLGLAFGSRWGEVRFSALADINNDSKVDGTDLARLSKNFGQASD